MAWAQGYVNRGIIMCYLAAIPILYLKTKKKLMNCVFFLIHIKSLLTGACAVRFKDRSLVTSTLQTFCAFVTNGTYDTVVRARYTG